MSNNNTNKLIEAISSSNVARADSALQRVLMSKVSTALEIKKVAITADIFPKDSNKKNKKKEETYSAYLKDQQKNGNLQAVITKQFP